MFTAQKLVLFRFRFEQHNSHLWRLISNQIYVPKLSITSQFIFPECLVNPTKPGDLYNRTIHCPCERGYTCDAVTAGSPTGKVILCILHSAEYIFSYVNHYHIIYVITSVIINYYIIIPLLYRAFGSFVLIRFARKGCCDNIIILP